MVNGPETKTPGPAGLYRSPAMSCKPNSYWALTQPGERLLPQLVRQAHQVFFERLVGLVHGETTAGGCPRRGCGEQEADVKYQVPTHFRRIVWADSADGHRATSPSCSSCSPLLEDFLGDLLALATWHS